MAHTLVERHDHLPRLLALSLDVQEFNVDNPMLMMMIGKDETARLVFALSLISCSTVVLIFLLLQTRV